MRSIVHSLLLLLGLASVCLGQTELPWTQLSLSACKVDTFREANPGIDGRGVVVAVLDTGVDMGVPGLQITPSSEVKVVDVQDFSGQGDVELSRALWNEAGDKIVHYADDGSPELYTPPPPGARPKGTTVWFGLVAESAYTNSAVSDVNDNGTKDDEFGVCVVSVDDGTDDDAVCYVDTDGDRDFANERPLKNYKLSYDTFTFARPKKEAQIVPLTCALNIFMGSRKVVIHHDDGGHGTHVAGIATGYRIMNQDGFNGVAPGAKVISMKLGENRLAGGSTTTGAMQEAFEYAARYAREHDVTVVCNLSFGIGSILEGSHTIDEFCDRLLRENPQLVICTSAGNEGPGLSSVGTPAGSSAAISVAALLAADTARDVMGQSMTESQLLPFSSRGGELDKPDIATPGRMTSTVPIWNRRGDFWGGTSMASPYAAGMCALLAQHVKEKHGILPRADWLKRALKNTADPMPGFNTLDFGGGKANMVRAFAKIDSLVEKHRDDPLYGFKVSTESPLSPKGKGRTAYWRSTYFPADHPQVFSITPIFVPQPDASAITGFSKRLTLHSDAKWCKPQQEQIYFRDEQSADVHVEYDAKQLTEPGLHVATIEGRQGDEVLLRLVNSVVVPYQAKAENDYRILLEDQVVEGYKVKRYFFAVPAGASAMHVTISAVEGKESNASINYLFRPDGTQMARGRLRLDTENDRREASYTLSKDLRPGVWELPVTTRADKTSAFSLEVRFDGITATPAAVSDLSSKPGSTPSGSVTFLNVFDRPTTVTLSGLIEGYRKTHSKELTPDEDKTTIDLAFTPDVAAIRIRVDVSDEDYAKFTDVPANVLDSDGAALAQDGMGEPGLDMRVENPDSSADSVSCTFELHAAFSEPNIEDSATFDIKVDYLYVNPIEIDVNRGGASQATLYPGVAAKFSWSLAKVPPQAPDGTATLGYIRGTERAAKQPVVEIEILGE
ncbi:MAG: S8 family serine peptidase [Planctomycetota bacterium]